MNISPYKYLLILPVFILHINSHGSDNSDIPSINLEIVKYVESVIGKKVDRGECWDLANQALIRTDAKWDRQYEYGKRLNVEAETVYPGDIIQFKDVYVRYHEGNTITTESMLHHTAIVYRVIENGVFEIAHQNTGGKQGRKVSIGQLNLNNVIQGELKFYRPVR